MLRLKWEVSATTIDYLQTIAETFVDKTFTLLCNIIDLNVNKF